MTTLDRELELFKQTGNSTHARWIANEMLKNRQQKSEDTKMPANTAASIVTNSSVKTKTNK